MLQATKKLMATRRERDEFWKNADGVTGLMRAGRLGQGLDRMDIGLGPKGTYKPVLEEMKKADPEDKSGYLAKYSFSGEKLVDLAMEKAEKKDYDAAEKEFDKWEANPRLSAKQKQELEAARFALYQRWPEKKDKVLPTLEKMRNVDPKSEPAKPRRTTLKCCRRTRRRRRTIPGREMAASQVVIVHQARLPRMAWTCWRSVRFSKAR